MGTYCFLVRSVKLPQTRMLNNNEELTVLLGTTVLWLLESELSLCILSLVLELLTEAETLGRENKRKA